MISFLTGWNIDISFIQSPPKGRGEEDKEGGRQSSEKLSRERTLKEKERTIDKPTHWKL